MEHIIRVEKHPEHVRTANDRDAAVWRPEPRHGLLERGTGRVPEQRLFVRRVGRERRDAPGKDQAAAQIGTRLLLMRVAPMHDHIDLVKPAFKEVLIGRDFEFLVELPPEITLSTFCRIRCHGRAVRKEGARMSMTGVAAEILDYSILKEDVSIN